MKKKKTIWGNCLVRNEEQWVWYALMSVIDYVDKILVWDNGSTDKTVEIIKTIKSKKIVFKEIGPSTKEEHPLVRQKMIEATKADWLLHVDGDEVWPKSQIEKWAEIIQKKGDKIESIALRTINLVGDVYHYQEEAAGRYQLAGRKGHLTLRGINLKKIPGLHALHPHGKVGFFDENGVAIQDRDPKKIYFTDLHYFHMTHLPRSSQDEKVPLRKRKRKYEIGLPLPKNIEYPEVFSFKRPKVVLSPWLKMSRGEWVRGAVQTPLKRIKRRILK